MGHSWSNLPMILANYWQTASFVTQKSLFTVTHALFYISFLSEMDFVYITTVFFISHEINFLHGICQFQHDLCYLHIFPVPSISSVFLLEHGHFFQNTHNWQALNSPATVIDCVFFVPNLCFTSVENHCTGKMPSLYWDGHLVLRWCLELPSARLWVQVGSGTRQEHLLHNHFIVLSVQTSTKVA